MFALSLYWFLYLGALGILIPFFGLYLVEGAGLSATEVGTVLATSPLVALVAPTFWGQIADRSSSRTRVLVFATLGVAASCALYGLLDGFWPLVAGNMVLAAFGTGVIPLVVSTTLAALGDDGLYRFGRIRVWGTIGFLVLVVLFPLIRRAAGPAVGLGIMFPIAAGLIAVSALVALSIADSGEPAYRPRRADWMELRRHAPFVRALAFVFLSFLFLQGPMNLFPLYLKAHGQGLDALGQMWILMLLPEIPLIAFSGAGLRRLGSRGLMAGGVAAGGLRWLLCGLVADPWVVYPAQLLHGVVVAGLSVGGSLYVEASVPARLRSTGQGLSSMAGAGVGAIFSSFSAGWLIDHAGVDAPFLIGGVGALALAALVTTILPPPSRASNIAP